MILEAFSNLCDSMRGGWVALSYLQYSPGSSGRGVSCRCCLSLKAFAFIAS